MFGKTLASRFFAGILVFALALAASTVWYASHLHASLLLQDPPSATLSFTWRLAFWVLIWAGLGVALYGWALVGMNRRLEALKEGAERMASGEFDFRLAVDAASSVAGVAEALNRMANQLESRFRMIQQQRNEQDAILASMLEGVLVVDREKRLIHLNPAAAELLEVEGRGRRGLAVETIVRQDVLLSMIQQTLSGEVGTELDLVLGTLSRRDVQVRGTPLYDTMERQMGGVFVFNDVTRLRRLERVRRDFVANASHELKTPLTAIQGFAETLLEGALQEEREARRFVEIIADHARKLHRLIEGLLELSRLERQSEAGDLELSRQQLSPILSKATASMQEQAKAGGISLRVDCAIDLAIRCNPILLERAVINLLDNAVRHSPSGASVDVSGIVSGGKLRIAVHDRGTGIDPSHQPRVFERFYRIPSGARAPSGSGLGLAIVRHIALAHGGEVQLESQPGKGSTFSLLLPNA